jgi:hypothetical protein
MKYACAAATLTVVIRPELFQRRIIGGEIGDIVGAEPFKNSLFIVVSDSVVKLGDSGQFLARSEQYDVPVFILKTLLVGGDEKPMKIRVHLIAQFHNT